MMARKRRLSCFTSGIGIGVVRLAHRFTGNADDAQDVLQETFKYMLGKFPGFKLTAAMTTFLYPVVQKSFAGDFARAPPRTGCR